LTLSLKQKTKTQDLTTGNLFVKILLFCVPLALMGILNLLYNSADLIVVKAFTTDKTAVGAIGSTSQLINLLINLFMGLSVGTNVVTARYFGQRNYNGIKNVVHTAILMSFVVGIFIGLIGIIFCNSLLNMMNNTMELSRVYLRIYFIGMPFNLLYNFAASILRALGDTKRPMLYISIAGLVNVLLNLFFVIVLKLGVAGVAIATIVSQFLSCVLILTNMYRTTECYQFRFKYLKIHKRELIDIIRIGLPAGIQSTIFSISNTIIQSSVNLFGESVINGNTAAVTVEAYVYTAMNSVYHAALAFTGQNVGAKKVKNIKKVVVDCLIIVTMIAGVFGVSFFLLHKPLLSLFARDEFEITVGYVRLHYLCLPYFLCGIMDVMCGVLRGLGYSTEPLIVSIIGVVGFRIGWIFSVFYPNLSDPLTYTDLNLLYVSYPISWIVTFTAHTITYFCVRKKVFARIEGEIKELLV